MYMYVHMYVSFTLLVHVCTCSDMIYICHVDIYMYRLSLKYST